MSRKLILCVGVIGAFALLAVPAAAGGPPLVLNGINDRAPTWTPMRSSSTVASRRPKWFGPSSSVTVSWCKPRSLLLQWSSRFAY